MIARPHLIVAAVLTLVTSACSDRPLIHNRPTSHRNSGRPATTPSNTSPAGLLYAVGSWSDERDLDSLPRTKTETFLRRYNSSGRLLWETFFDVGPAYDSYGGRGVKVSEMAVDGSGNVWVARGVSGAGQCVEVRPVS